MKLYWFMQRIKRDKGVFDKGTEVHESLESAIQSFHAYMAYGYNNPKFPDVDFVSCTIKNFHGLTEKPFDETWIRPEPNPEPAADEEPEV